MMSEAAAVLLAAGWGTLAPAEAWDLDEAALALHDACDAGGAPVEWPEGETCEELLTTILAVETGGVFGPYPTGDWKGSGAGPAQLCQPRNCYRNTRLGVACLPPHELLGGASALRHAVEVLRWKAARVGRRPERVFRAWNGGASPGFEGRALRVLRAIRGGGET